jgi:hypothetical protein
VHRSIADKNEQQQSANTEIRPQVDLPEGIPAAVMQV